MTDIAPRIPYPDPAGLEGRQRQSAESTLNIERMFGHLPPGLFEGFSAFSMAVMANPALDPVLRELAILRVGHLSGSAYEIFQHETFARHLGITEALISGAAEGQNAAVFDARQSALLAFVDALVRDVRPSDAVLSEARRHLSMAELMSVLLTVGQYMTICRLLETTGVPIEQGDGAIAREKLGQTIG